MRPSVLAGPIMPHPTMPTTMRSEGGACPSLPRALAGIIVGPATAAAVAAIKRRREIVEPDTVVFMVHEFANLAAGARVKNCNQNVRFGFGRGLYAPNHPHYADAMETIPVAARGP